MNWSQFPSLNSLKAFAELAETGSYRAAAERLNVTQAAVSQQVRHLEDHLGLPLAIRAGRGIELTVAGESLARELTAGFGLIHRGIERIAHDLAARPVHVTMSPAFAAEWLLPRINRFQSEHPEITLMFNPSSEVIELKPGGMDVAIRYRDRRRANSAADPVLTTDMVVIGAPSLLDGKDISTPSSLAKLPWLQELGTNEAAEWLTYHGVIPEAPLTVHHMPGSLIMSAVRRGQGITYTARAFFLDDLASGRVIEIFSEPLFGIYQIETQARYERPEVLAFLKWLRSEAEIVGKGDEVRGEF